MHRDSERLFDTKKEKVMKDNSTTKKISLKMKLCWSSLSFSAAVAYTLVAFLSLFGSDVLGLNVGAIGAILLVSKVFDGISDVLIGILVDKTHTRFGKARPYALAIVGFWICMALIFSAPKMSAFADLCYLFVLYTLAYSLFSTMYVTAEAPHMVNALSDTSQSLSLISFAGVVTALGGLIAGVMLPQFIAAAGTDINAWRRMVWILAIPLALLGTLRFFCVKEIRNVDADISDQDNKTKKTLSTKEMFSAIKENKYIMIIAILVFVAYFTNTLQNTAANYYVKYVLGDLGLGSIMALGMIPLLLVMMIIPALAKKFTLKKCIYALMVIGILGSLIRFIALDNVWVCFLSTCMFNVSCSAFCGFVGNMVVECIEYGEWKTGKRVEGLMGSIQSVMNKVGSGIGGAIGGMLLAMAGYDGTLEALPSSAMNMIIAMCTVIPAILIAIFILIFRKYDLEKQMPEIREKSVK